jgi:hypothetical protein
MFKKLSYVVLGFGIVLGLLFVSPAFAYNPDSFKDEELVTVNGQRPKIDIFVTELLISIKAEDFVDGIAKVSTSILNNGTVPCYLALEIQNVPRDLNVHAFVDTDFLHKGESTSLNIVVELTEQQEIEDFTFTILVTATLKP